LFPFHFFERTIIGAAIVSALIAAPSHPVLAGAPQLKTVQVEKVGDAKSLDDAARPASSTVLHLTFAVNSAETSGLADFVASQSDPTSPNYHKWLTPKEFGAKFGAAPSDIAAVSSYLTSHNFSSVKVWSNQLFVTADVTRAQAEKAFGVTIHGYDRPAAIVARGYSKNYYAPTSLPQIDASVASKIKGLFGLSNVAQRIPVGGAKALKPLVAGTGALDPPDLSKAYNIDTLHNAGLKGSGITIAIVSFTLFLPSDVTAFFTGEALPQPTISQIYVDGGPFISTITTTTATTGTVGTVTTVSGTGPTQVTTTTTTTQVTGTGLTAASYTITTTVTVPDYSGSDETDLDLETAGGQAPQADINVYEGANDGSFSVYNQIAEDDTAQVVSSSWGTDEDAAIVTQAYADSYDDVRAQLTAEGMTVFVASGDTGAYSATDLANGELLPAVSIDASSQFVTAVGGTELTLDSKGAWKSETAWSWNDEASIGLPDGGSNGGLSVYYPRPIWQVGPGVYNASSDGFRQVPDVAALGGLPGYNIYSTPIVDGTSSITVGTPGFIMVQGTSGSTPLWASAFALIEEQLGARQGNINPILYGFGTNADTVYHDIVSGTNGVYTCTPGWDFVTGWGSADFATLLSAFQGNSVPTTVAKSVHSFGSGLQMITIPYSYTGTGLTSEEMLTGLVTSTGAAAYAIAAWNPLLATYELTPTPPADVPVPGTGYWARFSSTIGGNLIDAGTTVTSLTAGTGIAPGWNLIGDPYLSAVNVSDLQLQTASGTYTFASAVTDSFLAPILYTYSGSAYTTLVAGGAFQPWAGYWIYSNVSGELIFPAP
jgi:kumamolisin